MRQWCRQRLKPRFDQLTRHCRDWFRQRADECRRCHECGGEVAALERICPHCGSGEPARVAIAPIAVFAFSAGLILLLIALLV